MINNTIYLIERAIADYLTYHITNNPKGLRYKENESSTDISPVTVEVRQGSIEYDKASYPSVVFYDANLDIDADSSLYKEPKIYLPEFSNADYESGELNSIVFRPVITSRGVYIFYQFEILTKTNLHAKDIFMQFINLLPVKKETAFQIDFGANGKKYIYINYDGVSRQQDEFKGSLRIFRRILRYRVSLPVLADIDADYKEYVLSLRGKVNFYQVPPDEDGNLDKPNKVLDYTIIQE